MTITREQLELAAKAAGLETVTHASLGICVRDKIPGTNITYGTTKWRPQHDHGQLLDLAMVCGMVIDNENGQVLCYCDGQGWRQYQSCPGDFPTLAEAVITAAADQQLAKEKKE